MTTPADLNQVNCPSCARLLTLTLGPDDTQRGRCECGVLVIAIETPAEDGLPVRQLVAQRRAARSERLPARGRNSSAQRR